MRIRERLAKGTAYALLASILIKLMMIVQSIVVARLLGPSGLGIFSILGNLQSMASLLASLGIPFALTKFVASSKSNEEKGNVFSASVILVLFLSFFSSLIYYFSSNYFSELYNEPILVSLISISAIIVIFNAFNEIGNSLLQGFQQITLLSKINVLKTPITIIFFITLIYFYGLVGAVIASLLSAILLIVIYFISLRATKNSLTFHIPDKKVYNKIMSYAIPSFLAGLVVLPAIWYSNTLLAVNVGFEEVGLFRISNTLSNLLLFIPAALSVPLFPLISELDVLDKKKLSRTMSDVNRIIILTVFPLAVILGLFSKYIIDVFYGYAYHEAWHPTFIMSITVFVMSIGIVQGNYLQGTGKVWEAFGLNLLWMSSFLLSLNLLIGRGINGIAYAYLISYVFHVLTIIIYFRTKLNIQFINLGKLSLFAVSIFSISYFLLQNQTGYIFFIESLILIIIMIYIILLNLNIKEKELIISILTKKGLL